MTKASKLQALTAEVRTLTAGLVSRQLTKALVALETGSRRLNSKSAEGQEKGLVSEGLSFAAVLSITAEQLNMPETAARLNKAATKFGLSKLKDDAHLTEGTRGMLNRLSSAVGRLKREAELGESNPASDKAMADIAFTMSIVADDLGFDRASSMFEAAASSARQGH